MALLQIIFFSTSVFATCTCGTNIDSNPTDITLFTSLPSPLTGSRCLNGELIINNTSIFEMNSLILKMGPSAKITINPYCSLRIVNNSQLSSCDQINLWDKIELLSNASIEINSSDISDMTNRLRSTANNPTLILNNCIFNKNWISVIKLYCNSENISSNKVVKMN